MKITVRLCSVMLLFVMLFCSCATEKDDGKSEDVRVTWSYNAEKNELSVNIDNFSSHGIEADLAAVSLEKADENGDFAAAAEKMSQFSDRLTVEKGKTGTAEISLSREGISPLESDTVYRLTLPYFRSDAGGAVTDIDKTVIMHSFTPRKMTDAQNAEGNTAKSEDVRITWSYNAEKNEVSALIENKSAHDIDIPYSFVPWVDRVEADGKYTKLIDGANVFTAIKTVKSGESLTETASLDFHKVEPLESGKTYRFSFTYTYKNDTTTVYTAFTAE